MTSFICYWINCVLFNLGSLEAEWDFFVSPLTIHSLQVSTVATATFAFPPAKPSRETPGQKREGEGERGRGEAAWMISSLQQLHTAARQSRNFLSNFQVAVQRKTSGRPRSEPEPARFFCVSPPREGSQQSCCVVCVSDLEHLVTSWNKRGRGKKSKTASCCVTTTMRKGEWRYEVMRGGACTQHLCEEDKAHPRAVWRCRGKASAQCYYCYQN